MSRYYFYKEECYGVSVSQKNPSFRDTSYLKTLHQEKYF